MEFVVEIECFHKVFFKNGPHIQSAVRTVRSAVRTFCADRSILDPSTYCYKKQSFCPQLG